MMKRKICAMILAGALSLSALSACSLENADTDGKNSGGEQNVTSENNTSSDAGQNETNEDGASSDAENTGTDEGGQSANTYDVPVLGLSAVFSDALVQRMNQDVFLINNAEVTEDGTALQYGVISWYLSSGENGEDGFELDDMQCAGVLGVYRTDLIDQLDELTGCSEHQEIGKSVDEKYVYYLSINPDADPELTAEISKTQVTITEMAAIDAPTEDSASESGGTSKAAGTSVGDFTTQDVNGTAYTKDIFKDYDLTLVNIFTTWCSPCVAEMPELEELYQQMKDQGVGVVGVVLDVLDEKGEVSQEDLERAQLLVERTGVTYPVLLPDSTYMNGRLTGIEAVPETFFVDKDGTIVGETYSGSGDLEYWLSTVEKELAGLKEAQ